jgi:HEAT repeat protein
LITILGDRDADIRIWSAIHLSTHLHAEAAIPGLLALLDDPKVEVRGIAAGSLAAFGGKASAGSRR